MSKKRATGIFISPRTTRDYIVQEHHDYIQVGVSDGNYILEGKDKLLEKACQVPVVIGSHYLRSGVQAKSQVETYLKAIDGWPIHGHMVDFEKDNNTKSPEFAMKCKTVVDRLTAETGQQVVTYGNRYCLNNWMFLEGVTWLRRSCYPLHIAQYPYRGWNEALKTIRDMEIWQPILPAGKNDWTFWQYSADGNQKGLENGIPGYWWRPPSVCLDVFNGTAADLKKWLDIEEEKECQEEIKEGQIKILNAAIDEVIEIRRNLEEA